MDAKVCIKEQKLGLMAETRVGGPSKFLSQEPKIVKLKEVI